MRRAAGVGLLDAGPADGEDAEIAMLDRRSGGDVGNRRRTQVIRMEAMIRHQNHRGVLAGFFSSVPSISS